MSESDESYKRRVTKAYELNPPPIVKRFDSELTQDEIDILHSKVTQPDLISESLVPKKDPLAEGQAIKEEREIAEERAKEGKDDDIDYDIMDAGRSFI